MYLRPILETFAQGAELPQNMNPIAAANYYNLMQSHYSVEVGNSYKSLSDYLVDQYNTLISYGLQVAYLSGDYYSNSQEMFADLNNCVLKVRKTYGDDYTDLPDYHPMSGTVKTFDGKRILNDVFRVVHDTLGHYAIRASFSPDGEALAWLHHRSLLPRSAHLALWCETRGQNTWTNFWANHQTLPIRERPFAVQKYGMVPGEFI